MSEDSTVRVERGPFEMVPHWLLYDLKVNALAVRLYLVLRQHADASGECFPSRQRLCKLLGVSLPTLDKARGQLVEVGAITIRQRKDQSRQYSSSLYIVHWDRQDFYERATNFFGGGNQESCILTNTHLTKTSSTTSLPGVDDLTLIDSPPHIDPDSTPMGDSEGDARSGDLTDFGGSDRGEGYKEVPVGAWPPSGPQIGPEGVPKIGSIPRGVSRSRASRGRQPYPEGFEKFWKSYPRKAGKKAALSAWKSATKEAGEDTLVQAAERYANDPNRDPKYTPHPATWLRQGRWEDEPLPVASIVMTGGQRRMKAYNEIYEAISNRKGIEQ